MALRKSHPGKAVLETEQSIFELQRFADKGHCELEYDEDFAQDRSINVYGETPYYSPSVTWNRIRWERHSFEFVTITLEQGRYRSPYSVLVGPNVEAVESFMIELSKFSNLIEGAVLVFNDGCWQFDQELYQDIQGSTFDNLILPPGFIDHIREDISSWLSSREIYETHRIPWKRGMILVGPPGNGKTHLIKSLVNHFGLNTIYVRNFGSDDDDYARNIKLVFDRARACTPALLILEDLDSLVNNKNRSYFLNELDGFALNTGILVVASANDPAKLDPALVNRPSRFDRRYVFALPELPERSRYLSYFTSSLVGELQLTAEEADRVAAETEGFSFAYLKELVLSSMMAWISAGRNEAMAEQMLRQVVPLRDQMSLGISLEEENEPSIEDPTDPTFAVTARLRRKFVRPITR